MSTFRKFEAIEAWQKARELVREVYAVTAQGRFAKDFALRDQIRRAAISVMSNIAEGHGRGGKREFIQFLSIARGSAFEVISHLYVALDQVYIDQQSFGSLSSLAEEVCKMSSGLIRYLNDTAIRGTKYKQTEN